MLILSRKLGESIVIDGRIHVTVMRVDGEVVKLGIAAPAEVPVHRKEVYEEIQRSNQQALTRPTMPLPKLPKLAIKKPTAPPPVAEPAKL
jgi:carbon storage regulator